MSHIINIESPFTVVEVDETHVEVSMQMSGVQGPAGPTGPQGPSGASHATYIHNQNTPSSSWAITHNLSCFPSVSVVDSANNVVFGEVNYLSNNALTVTFSGSFSGQAFLN